jgi:antitoxin MazE
LAAPAECGYTIITTGGAVKVKSRVTRIGISKGIRIPNPLIEQTGLHEEAEIQVDKHLLIVGPEVCPRAGWDAAFRKMADAGDDAMLDGDVQVPASWEEAEWEW